MAATHASPMLTSTMLASTTLARPALVRHAARPVARDAVRDVDEARGADEAHGLLGLGGLRLTRRGRLVLFVLALVVSLPLVGLGGRAVASEPGRPTEVTVHTVAPGETLWGFARQIVQPGQDVRDVVDHLRDLNELTSGALSVGQTILIPKV